MHIQLMSSSPQCITYCAGTCVFVFFSTGNALVLPIMFAVTVAIMIRLWHNVSLGAVAQYTSRTTRYICSRGCQQEKNWDGEYNLSSYPQISTLSHCIFNQECVFWLFELRLQNNLSANGVTIVFKAFACIWLFLIMCSCGNQWLSYQRCRSHLRKWWRH